VYTQVEILQARAVAAPLRHGEMLDLEQRFAGLVRALGEQIVDRAIQVHGGGGVSDDFPLAWTYAHLRTLRLADGPDEVHWHVVGRAEINRYANDSAPAVSKTTESTLGGQFSGPS